MSSEQKKVLSEVFIWISRGIAATGIWFLSQLYNDFQSFKNDLQQMKVEVSSVKASLEIMKSYDLKPKQ